MSASRQLRTKVFVSYSHQDRSWLKRLQIHMRPLIRNDDIKYWDDTSIQPGSDWRAEIGRALATTKVAVLLISADFLASEFIATDELPELLKAAEEDGAIIIPLILSPSRFTRTPSLARFQSINSPDQPLVKLKKWQQEELLVQATETIRHAISVAAKISDQSLRDDEAEALGRPSPAPDIQPGKQQELPDHEGTPSPANVSAVDVTDKIEGDLTGVDNTRLYWQGWLPAVPVTGVLLLCHGAYEHSGRYQNVVDTLALDGWAVYGLDLRGHGRSRGEPVHVERFSDWVDDFDRFRREVVSRHQDLPVFVLGHCLGAQIALAYALDHQEALRGLVLSAPFLATAAMPRVVRLPGRVVSRLLPRARFKLVGPDKISQDPDVVKRYRDDPLVYQGNATLTMARIVEQQFKILIERSRYLRIPVLIQHGAEDAIADPEGSRRLDRAVGSPDRTFILYEGLWNEIYNEPERQRPLNDLRKWLASHRSSPSTQRV